MSKNSRGNYTSFYTMIILIISCIGIAIKFFIEVNKHGLWKECIISICIFAGINYLCFLLANSNIISLKIFFIILLITFITFFVYWGTKFSKNP